MVPQRAERFEKQDRHVAPHRAWKSLKSADEFTAHEHDHILRCVECLRLFLLCLESDNFGSVLKQLEDSAA